MGRIGHAVQEAMKGDFETRCPFELACSTSVRAIFHTPELIRSFPHCYEMELTGGYEEERL